MNLFAFRYLWDDKSSTNDYVNKPQEDAVATSKEEVQESLLEANGLNILPKLKAFIGDSDIRMANVRYARVQADKQAKLREIQLSQLEENAAKTMSKVWSLLEASGKPNITEIMNTFLSINGVTEFDKGVLAALLLDKLTGNSINHTKYHYESIQELLVYVDDVKKTNPEDVHNPKKDKKRGNKKDAESNDELLYPKEFLFLDPLEDGDEQFKALINKYGKSNVGQFYYNITEVLPDISVDSFPILAFQKYWSENGTLPKDFIRIIFKTYALKLFEKKTISGAVITRGIKSGVLSGYDLIINESFYSSYEDAIFRAKTNFLFVDKDRKTVLAAFSPEYLFDIAKRSGLNAYVEGEVIAKYPCYVLTNNETLVWYKNAKDDSGYDVHKGEEATAMIELNNVLYNNIRNDLLYQEENIVPTEGVDNSLMDKWKTLALNNKSAIANKMTQHQAKDYDSSGVANELQNEDSREDSIKFLKDDAKTLYDNLVAASNLTWSSLSKISMEDVKASLQNVVNDIGEWIKAIDNNKQNNQPKSAEEMKELIKKQMGARARKYQFQANGITSVDDITDSSTVQSRLSILLIAYVYRIFDKAAVNLDSLSKNLTERSNTLQGASNNTSGEMSDRIRDCLKYTQATGEIVKKLLGINEGKEASSKKTSEETPESKFVKTPIGRRRVKSKNKKN